eukprot:5317777-Pyramimonas_sp.AAC.1
MGLGANAAVTALGTQLTTLAQTLQPLQPQQPAKLRCTAAAKAQGVAYDEFHKACDEHGRLQGLVAKACEDMIEKGEALEQATANLNEILMEGKPK